MITFKSTIFYFWYEIGKCIKWYCVVDYNWSIKIIASNEYIGYQFAQAKLIQTSCFATFCLTAKSWNSLPMLKMCEMILIWYVVNNNRFIIHFLISIDWKYRLPNLLPTIALAKLKPTLCLVMLNLAAKFNSLPSTFYSMIQYSCIRIGSCLFF